ncbi:MAG: magnesium/cobalt transporter CorA [Pseudomonadota bacterium]
MIGFKKKMFKKAGLPPGTLIHVGEKKAEKIRIQLFDYDETHVRERELEKIEDCFPYKDSPTVTWINIAGLHQVDVIEKVGNHFGLHPLVLEDILHTDQRPKMDDYDDYLFIVTKMLYYDGDENGLLSEQVSIVLGPNYVISFQESEKDIFDPMRDRLRKSKGRMRKMGADYLAYSLMDAIVDHYFIVLERIGGEFELLEEELVTDPKPDTFHAIHLLKHEMIFLRKSVWPLRETINGLEKGESDLIREKTIFFLRDLYDHTIQVIDTIETFRDMLSGMLDVYLSSVSNRMNEVMKVLTIMATIFIPLTFIAGVYGMNFKYMPELEWHWGYPLVAGSMIVIGLGMMIWFRHKRWL